MTTPELSDALRLLLNQHMLTLDHVALLLALRADAEHAVAPADLATAVRLDRAVVDRALRDLVASRLAHREGGGFQYAAAPEVQPAIEELAEMYHTKPVSLVRAIYDRPVRAAQSFADAFRLRKPGE